MTINIPALTEDHQERIEFLQRMYKEHQSLFKYVPGNIIEGTISQFSDEQLVNLHNYINRINEIDKEYFNVNLQPSNSPLLNNQEQVTPPPTNVTASTQVLRRSSRTP